MRNSQGSGDILELTAPASGIVSGDITTAGPLVVIAAHDAPSGSKFVAEPRGLFLLPKVTAEAWTEGAAVYWDATAGRATIDPDNIPLGVCVAAVSNPSATGLVLLRQGGALTGPDQWYAKRSYIAGQLVLHQGGWWKATAPNTNSEPISGNTDWTLVAGTPYVDTILSTADIRTLNSVWWQTVPAPGANNILLPDLLVLNATYTTAFNADQDMKVSLGTLTTSNAASVFWTVAGPDIAVILLNVAADPNFLVPTYFGGGGSQAPANSPLTLSASVDIVGGGGDGIMLARQYYRIMYLPAFYPITAVNQGLQQFTVTDAAAALNGATGAFAVIGSTGNNATYTIVSAVSGAGSTVITTVEAIPDATADGWVQAP